MQADQHSHRGEWALGEPHELLHMAQKFLIKYSVGLFQMCSRTIRSLANGTRNSAMWILMAEVRCLPSDKFLSRSFGGIRPVIF